MSRPEREPATTYSFREDIFDAFYVAREMHSATLAVQRGRNEQINYAVIDDGLWMHQGEYEVDPNIIHIRITDMAAPPDVRMREFILASPAICEDAESHGYETRDQVRRLEHPNDDNSDWHNADTYQIPLIREYLSSLGLVSQA